MLEASSQFAHFVVYPGLPRLSSVLMLVSAVDNFGCRSDAIGSVLVQTDSGPHSRPFRTLHCNGHYRIRYVGLPVSPRSKLRADSHREDPAYLHVAKACSSLAVVQPAHYGHFGVCILSLHERSSGLDVAVKLGG